MLRQLGIVALFLTMAFGQLATATPDPTCTLFVMSSGVQATASRVFYTFDSAQSAGVLSVNLGPRDPLSGLFTGPTLTVATCLYVSDSDMAALATDGTPTLYVIDALLFPGQTFGLATRDIAVIAPDEPDASMSFPVRYVPDTDPADSSLAVTLQPKFVIDLTIGVPNCTVVTRPNASSTLPLVPAAVFSTFTGTGAGVIQGTLGPDQRWYGTFRGLVC